MKVTQAEFEAKLKRVNGDKFDVLGTYVANNVKIALRCNTCGSIIYKRPCKMTCDKPDGCYVCTGKNRWKNTEYFKNEVAARFGDEFAVLGDYEKARKPLLVRHNLCGDEYMVSPDNLLRGKGCPKCARRKSKYSRKVEDILTRMELFYIREKRFEDCKDVRVMPFDFYIPSLNVCIEVDGEQHYLGWDRKGGDLEYIQNHDAMKTEYCERNGIKLIRLPYFSFDDFEDMLKVELHVNTEVTHSDNTE